jgi:hypothetical protein
MDNLRVGMLGELDSLFGENKYISVLDISAVLPRDFSLVLEQIWKREIAGVAAVSRTDMPALESGIERFRNLSLLISNRVTLISHRVYEKVRVHLQRIRRLEGIINSDLSRKRKKLESHPELCELVECMQELNEFKELAVETDPLRHRFVYGSEYAIAKHSKEYLAIFERSKRLLPQELYPELIDSKAGVFSIAYYLVRHKGRVVLINSDSALVELSKKIEQKTEIKYIDGRDKRARLVYSPSGYSIVLFDPNLGKPSLQDNTLLISESCQLSSGQRRGKLK